MHEFKFAKKYGRMAALLMMTFFSICCIIGGLLCGFKSENYVDLLLKFNTWTYQQSAVMFFISTIPAVIDLILDMTQMNEICIFCPKYVGRVLITISCFVVSIQFKVLDITPSIFNMTTNRSLSYISSLFCLRLLLACSMLLILMANNDRIFNFRNVFCINAFVCIATVMKFFTLTNTGTVHIGTLIFTQIGLIFVIFMFIVWVYRMCTMIKVMTVNDYTCILYFITAFIVGTMTYLSIMQKLVTGNYVDTGISHYNDKELAFANYALTVLSIILTVVSSRISRYEAYVYMKNNIKTKTEYIRFISHELRTPLNSVFLGLNLSISQIPEHSDNEENKERRDTLMEIASACSAALDILNQLLFFDKLDNAILELNKSKTRVTELIHDAIKMFTVQIREKNIDMKIQNNFPGILSTEQSTYIASLDRLSPHLSAHINGGSNTTKQNHYSIYSNEMIEIDKNKMIQVIRNIVSNAIKFTPEYGQISINLKFEMNPDILMTNEKGDNKRVFPVKKTVTMIGTTDVFSKLNTVIIHDNHLTNPSSTSPICEDIGHSIECSPTTIRDIYSYPSYLSTTNDSNFRTLSDHVITVPKRGDDDSNHKLENEMSISPRVYGDSVEGYLVIEITDTGAGISDENQQKLFKQIVQFNPEILQNGGGSGLGMWISKGIVDLHGGKIAVSSEGEGRGCTFTIKLPMTRVYDESIISSSKLSDCIHIKDHTSLNLIQMSSQVPSLERMMPNRGVMADTAVGQQDTHVDDICNTSQNNVTDESSTFPRHRSLVGDVMVDTYRSELSESNNVFTEYAFRSYLLTPQQTSMVMSSPFIYSSSSSSSTTSSFETMKSHSLSVSPILHTSTLLPSSASLSSSSMKKSHQDTSQHMVTFDVSDSETILKPSFRRIHDIVDIVSPSTNDLNTVNEVYNTPIIPSQIQDIILTSTSISSQCNQSSHDPLIDHLNSSLYALKTGNQNKSSKEYKTVLVVDDSSMNRKMLCRLLKSSGYMCIQANDGIEAVTYIRNSLKKTEMSDSCQFTSVMTSSPVTSSAKNSTISTATLKHDSSYKSTKHSLSHAYIDCIIMDFMMPNMDGPTATAEIRKLGYTGPIIGATGNALQADIDYFIEKGATKVLVKPLDMSSVLSSIQTP